MKYFLSILLLVFSSTGFALSFSDITEECEERKGNEAALKQFSDSIEGERVKFNAKLETIKNVPLMGSYAIFEVDYYWDLDVYVTDEETVDMRVGTMYEFTAKIESHYPWGNGLKVLSPSYGYPWECSKPLELTEAVFD
jgi:hypothetical protein